MGKKKDKKLSNVLYKNLFWILVIIGMFVLYMSSWTVFNDYVQDILEKIGLSIFSSGVFASVLKSIQFTGIFKDEIEKVVLGTKFIENRNDLPQLWRKVSKGVYNQKFPEISDELDDIVLNSYFPTRHKYYYQDFRFTLTINELTPDHIIKFTQAYSFQVNLAEGENEAKIERTFTFDKKPGLENLINNIEYFLIDGEDVHAKVKPEISENEFEKIMVYSLTIANKRSFLLECKERREYCIDDDNFKLIRVNAITKEMDVSITYPPNMDVSFFNIGLINKFERKHIEHERTISRVHKKGLILPNQGFGITFGIKQ